MMTATYTCNPGYNIVGSNTQTCGSDTNWTPEPPTCERTQVIIIATTRKLLAFTAVDCGSLTVPNGQVSAPSGTTFMSTASYTCDDGYTVNGATIRTCQASGNWDLAAPSCDRE